MSLYVSPISLSQLCRGRCYLAAFVPISPRLNFLNTPTHLPNSTFFYLAMSSCCSSQSADSRETQPQGLDLPDEVPSETYKSFEKYIPRRNPRPHPFPDEIPDSQEPGTDDLDSNDSDWETEHSSDDKGPATHPASFSSRSTDKVPGGTRLTPKVKPAKSLYVSQHSVPLSQAALSYLAIRYSFSYCAILPGLSSRC